jgi:hypothetical protein
MTSLLDKIERRLGTEPLNLPKSIAKDNWAKKVISNETLDTFSRYYPHKILYILGPQNKKGEFYLIDEDTCENQEILGAADIDWHEFSSKSPTIMGGFGTFNMMNTTYDVEDIMMTQMAADHNSLFNNGIYLDWYPPNKIRLTSATANNHLNFNRIPINLLIKHPNNLMTIAPTKMETFEALAQADVATYLYEYLKHYDGIETVFANTDLKLSSIEEKANKREEIVQELKDNYVSAANTNQPIMITVN